VAGCCRRWYFHVLPRGMPVIYLCVTILLRVFLLLTYYDYIIIMLVSLLYYYYYVRSWKEILCIITASSVCRVPSKGLKTVLRINYLCRRRPDRVNYCDVATRRSFSYREINSSPPHPGRVYVTGRRRKQDGYTELAVFCPADFFIT